MTLVTMFHEKEQTVAAADLLLSSKEQWSRIPIPTRETQLLYDRPSLGLPSSFVQKLMFLNEDIMFCWAGNRQQAHDLVLHLQEQPLTRGGLVDGLCRYRQESIGMGENQVCGVLMHHDAGETWSIDVGIDYSRPKFRHFENVRIFGSGVADAMDYFRRKDQAKAIDHRPIHDALFFWGHAMAAQSHEGFGLPDAWGGGFQLVYPDNGRWQLLQSLLVRAWVITDATRPRLHRGPFFYLFYVGEMLFICRAFGEDGGSLFSVPPLLAPGLSVTFVSGRRRAEVVLDMVQHPWPGRYWYSVEEKGSDGPEIYVAAKGSYALMSDDEEEALLSKFLSHLPR